MFFTFLHTQLYTFLRFEIKVRFKLALVDELLLTSIVPGQLSQKAVKISKLKKVNISVLL